MFYRENDGTYHLPATSVDLNGDEELAIASVAAIERDRSGAFKEAAEWSTLDIMKSGTDVESVFSTAKSIYADQTALNLAPCSLGSGDSELFARATSLDPWTDACVGELMLSSYSEGD